MNISFYGNREYVQNIQQIDHRSDTTVFVFLILKKTLYKEKYNTVVK